MYIFVLVRTVYDTLNSLNVKFDKNFTLFGKECKEANLYRLSYCVYFFCIVWPEEQLILRCVLYVFFLLIDSCETGNVLYRLCFFSFFNSNCPAGSGHQRPVSCHRTWRTFRQVQHEILRIAEHSERPSV